MTVRCSLGHENPDGSAFCDECGEPLSAAAPTDSASVSVPAAAPAAGGAGTQICPSCGATNPAGETFCSNCGVNLLGAPASVPPLQPVPRSRAFPWLPSLLRLDCMLA